MLFSLDGGRSMILLRAVLIQKGTRASLEIVREKSL